jgi:ATP-dependent Lon protease
MSDFESYQSEGVILSKYYHNRKNFSSDEWIKFLIRSNGLDPNSMSRKEQLLYLARLIPLVEACTNLLELGPPGTGKSFVYENASDYCRMLLGGEITMPNLVFNKTTKQIGLVFTKDVLCFDEINKENAKINNLIPKLQQIMASNRVERGELEAMTDVSLVFQGNIDFTYKNGMKVPRDDDHLKVLPKDMYHTAFLDRIHMFIHGWELPRISNQHINHNLGLISNYFSEILHKMRKDDFSYLIDNKIEFFRYDKNKNKFPISIRDKIALLHIISGYIKLLYPDKVLVENEWIEIIELAIFLRQNIIDEMSKLDPTLYRHIGFNFRSNIQAKSQEVMETVPQPTEEVAEAIIETDIINKYQFNFNQIHVNSNGLILNKIPFWLIKIVGYS